MKVKIGPYLNYFGPYQLAEKLMFWVPKDSDRVNKVGSWIADTWIGTFLIWVYNKRTRKVEIHIDKWDTWGMDNTLACIILPMLKQLKDTKHGAPFVDNEDVPPELHYNNDIKSGDIDDNWFKRWDYVMDEMIFSFESVMVDWEDQFSNCNNEEYRHIAERIQNGFILFGKYYQNLWD